jgi:outer membrane immunogenic protein
MMRTALLIAAILIMPLAGAQNLTGPYVGGYLAGGSADAHWDLSNGTSVNHSMSGGLIGVQGGYNWHRGHLLLGVQADIGAGSINGSSRCPPPNTAFECQTELLSLFTLRARVGPVFDNVALYATGGIASAGIQTTVDNHLVGGKDDDLQGHAGWIAGIGVTGFIARRVLWQAEFLRFNLGSEEHIMFGVRHQVKVSGDVFRVGAHYKFF